MAKKKKRTQGGFQSFVTMVLLEELHDPGLASEHLDTFRQAVLKAVNDLLEEEEDEYDECLDIRDVAREAILQVAGDLDDFEEEAEEDLYECGVCMEEFDANEEEPHVCPDCGQHYCQTCARIDTGQKTLWIVCSCKEEAEEDQ
ncbi:RING finger protein [Tautonia plasticadhaerens]|uniref:RING-type domain-containing protein n=1 Tax=Tautonia plasticadhaerens TaxID=2527974 RepID=A0A518H3X0_9BACT|nr:hypothetical protein [Tautonia plasticadhaerens]QDV35512.1 hypothetical protein ElP_34150 [Tautonia plasticadhaerens]